MQHSMSQLGPIDVCDSIQFLYNMEQQTVEFRSFKRLLKLLDVNNGMYYIAE